MGFSTVTAAAVIGITFVVIFEIFSGTLLPAITDVNEAYDENVERAIEQRQSDLNITDITDDGWWNTNWDYRKMVIIDHTKVQDSLNDFPVLIYRASDTNLADHAQSDGDDIVFISSDNAVKYNHEIEEYTSGTGELTAWVKISNVSKNKDTPLFMYYGNAGCGSQENIEGTWDTNFKMVQHLNESSGTLFDSTSNNNDGTNNEATYNSSSKIDGGYDFDGINDYIECGNDNSLDITNSITLEGWVKDPPIFINGLKTDIKIIDKRDEKLLVMPGETFSTDRTIAGNKNEEVIFVSLFSSDIKLNDMTVDGESIFNGIYSNGIANSNYERKIEQIRSNLPVKVKELNEIAYSKPFNLKNGKATIEMLFETKERNNLFINSRISYLVISLDGTYDFESTTYITSKLSFIYWFNRFIFKSLMDTKNGETVDKEPQVVEEPFIYEKVPEHSLGPSTIKRVNLSYFWNYFNRYSYWHLEAWDPINETWLNLTQHLNIVKDRSANNKSEKVSLEFIAPITADYQLRYTIDRPVIDYINNSDQNEYILTFPIGDNEEYTTFFNFSDIANLPNVIINHGVTNIVGENQFWFNVKRDNILAGTNVVLDPIFGNIGEGTSGWDGDDMPGGYFQMGSISGEANSISAFFSTAGGATSGRAAIYDDSGNLLANGGTDENAAVEDGWVTFTYSTSPSLSADQYYYLVVFTNSFKSEIQYETTGGGGLYIDTGQSYPTFPATYARTVQDNDALVSIYCTYTETGDPPVVVTNASTGVEDVNATLHGYLSSNGSADTTTYFLWDNDASGEPYANNQSNGVTANLSEFQYNAGSLNSGDLYYFNTKANNTGGWDESGGELTFFTEPPPVTNLLESSSTNTTLSYTWTNASITTGAQNYTHIQYQTGSNPTTITEGTNTYNNTQNTDDTTILTPGTHYYFSAFSWGIEDNIGRWNDTYATMDAWTNPGDPTEPTTTNGTNWINITYTHGTNGETTLIRRNTTGNPTYPETITDGDEIQNNTNTWMNNTGLTPEITYYYTLWTWDTDGNKWCDNNLTQTGTTVINDEPYADNLIIHSEHDYTLDNLIGTYDYNDNESDAETGTSYEWYTNFTGSWTALGVNSPSLDSNYTNETGWYKFEVTPRDQYGDGNATNSSAFEVTSLNESAGTITGTYNEEGNLTIGNGASLTITGQIVSVGNITIQNGGTLTLGTQNHNIYSLTLNNGGTLTATSGTINITNQNNSQAIDLDGTFNHNTGTIEINTPSNTNLDLKTTGNLYNLIIDTSGYTISTTAGNNGTVSNNLSIEAGKLQIGDNLTVAEMNIESNGEFEITGGKRINMTEVLYQNGYFNITNGHAYDVNLSSTKFNLTNANQISLYPYTTPPTEPNSNNFTIGKFVNITDITGAATVDLNITYQDTDINGVNETLMTMFNYNWTTATWTQITDTGVNTDANYVWGNSITSFSPMAPGGPKNQDPIQSSETPSNGTTDQCPIPELSVKCIDNDDDTMNATWLSNSSGPWIIFATNNTIGKNEFIYQTNNNFSSSGETYYWSVNLTDGMGGWDNETYHFTTNYEPLHSNEEPTDGNTSEPLNVMLNITLTDNDVGDTMNATWWSNSTGPWAIFATNNTIASGETINQSNSNFSEYSETYWWSVNVTDGCNWTNATYSFTTLSAGDRPNVTTNASTGVEEINATLWGWLEDNGTLDTECGFWWDTVSGGTSNEYNAGIVTEGDTFSYNAEELTPGQLYYFKAWANNSVELNDTANEETFLTKPNATTSSSLTVQANSSSKIYLTWTPGDGANTTYIERNQITSWNLGEGIQIYNDSGTNYEDTSLTPGVTYYYQAWSYVTWTYNPTLFRFSDGYDSESGKTKNKPVISNESPTNESVGVSLNPTLSIQVNHSDERQMNITWYWGNDSSCPNLIGTNGSVNNGTYEMDNDNNFSKSSKTYYWKVTINDGHGEWANATYHFRTTGVNKEIISKEHDAYALEISADGTQLYGYINNTNVTASIDTNWHHVAITYDGSTLSLYKDGQLVNSTSLSGDIPTNTNDLMLGNGLSGTLDELRISNTARSEAWISTSYTMMDSPTTFIRVEAEQTQTYTYLNITFENSGNNNIKISKITLLVNGTITSFVYLQPYVYPLKETEIYANVSAVGTKRNKLITENGISDYEEYG